MMKILSKVLTALTLTVGLLTGTASASTLGQVKTNTLKLYKDSSPQCTLIAVNTPAKNPVLITAAHCVDDPKADYTARVTVLEKDLTPFVELVYHLELMAINTETDMAILRTKAKFGLVNGVDVATPEELKTLEFGQEVFTMAYPATLDITMTKGEFGGLVRGMNGKVKVPVFRTTAPMVGGSSGGGLYASFNGEYKLIGTISYGIQGVDFINHVIPISNATDGLAYTDVVWE